MMMMAKNYLRSNKIEDIENKDRDTIGWQNILELQTMTLDGKQHGISWALMVRLLWGFMITLRSAGYYRN